MLEVLKPAYNRAIRPALRVFVRAGISPDHLTIAGVPVFAAGAWCVGTGHWPLSLAFVVFGALMDGWDGLLARETGAISRFGAILDSSCDRLTEILWLLGFLCFYLTHPEYGIAGPLLSCGAMSGSLMVSYVKARCEGEAVECSKGFFQRPERIVFLIIATVTGPRIMVYGLGILTALSYATAIQRLLIARKNSPRE